MVVDISKLKSHPDKTLFTHLNGVLHEVKKLTNLKIAEIAAIFHDLGKMNFGFQLKIYPTIEHDLGINISQADRKYSHHAYLSAYAFFCYYLTNGNALKKYFDKYIASNEVLAIIVMIAKHHGDLPNFLPSDINREQVLFKDEIGQLFQYLETANLPFDDFPQYFDIPKSSYSFLLKEKKAKEVFSNLCLDVKSHVNHLQFYQETQFSFAALIQADKKDAGCMHITDKENIKTFCSQYSSSFNNYLATLKPYQDKPINRLRTKIRHEVSANISKHLRIGDCRVFDLTAPTGSGKTLSLLSVAEEIIKSKGAFRIMYCLPFLSITEQVEKEVLNIFEKQRDFVQRIDSKSVNQDIQKLQEELDSHPNEDKYKELETKQFQEDVFEYPFIITTFVQFFEAFLKNKNADLLKLPSFSNSIFLIDEIQALPPRLYGFFVAYLDAFCKRFNSYAVISTATMPNFELPTKDIKAFFPNYRQPPKLLSEEYFNHDLFNRYVIDYQNTEIEISNLAEKLVAENKSVLCVVNTIDDSKDLFKELKGYVLPNEVCLLNTHFTPNDRKWKIDEVKFRLESGERIILVSTQLIEAGVNLDFPVLYRDMAIMPSIVQSAGRCNRHGKLNRGKVVLFHLNNRGAIRSKLIYKGKDSKLLYYTKNILEKSLYKEKELFVEQKKYFQQLGNDLMFGEHEQGKETLNFISLIKEAMFASLGKFKLIDDDYYGETYRMYVPKDNTDKTFDKLESLVTMLANSRKEDKQEIRRIKSHITSLLKEMSNQIVQVRLKKDEIKPTFLSENVYGIYLLDIDDYDKEIGVHLSVENLIF